MRYLELISETRPPNSVWFADSKVIDRNGTPLVVYHGTDAKFAQFAQGHKNGMTNRRNGFYFTDKLEAAQEFGDAHGYYLSIRRPADFRYDGGQEYVDRALAHDPALAEQVTDAVGNRYGRGGGNTVGRLGSMGLLQTDAFLAALVGIGCDGMFFEDHFAGHSFTSFVAFEPSQIKRVTRTPLKAASPV